MYKKETKEVKEQRQVVVAVVCDNCGKEHKGSKMPVTTKKGVWKI